MYVMAARILGVSSPAPKPSPLRAGSRSVELASLSLRRRLGPLPRAASVVETSRHLLTVGVPGSY